MTRVLNYLQSIYKLNIHILKVDKATLIYDLEKIKYQFADYRPNIVVLSHASNVCGVVAPINEICNLSKVYNAINVIDMAQTAGLIDTDLSSDIIDFAVFAGHKTLYSPFGVAGFISSGKTMPKPLLYGGTGIDSANQSLPETMPERYEIASPNIMAISGLNASLRWIEKTSIRSIFEREKINHKKLLSVLKKFDNVRIVSPIDEDFSIGVVSCIFDDYSSDSMGRILNDHDIAVRTGLHCAPFAHHFLGTFPSGTVRFSVSYFNDDSDFEKLQKVLMYIEENI